jgi:hypothetical protein
MFNETFVPKLPFSGFKWKWASLQCTESLNIPIVYFGILYRLRIAEKKRWSTRSEEFAKQLKDLQTDLSKAHIKVSVGTRSGARNIIRNSGQYWKALGVLSPESHGQIVLTDFGRKVADREIDQTEFVAICIKQLTLPNRRIQGEEECSCWKTAKILLHPLELILRIVSSLHKEDRQQGYLTTEELDRVIQPLSSQPCVQLDDYVDFVLAFRKNKSPILNKWPICSNKANDKRIIREFLLFLKNYRYLNVSKVESEDNYHEKYFYNEDLQSEIESLLAIPDNSDDWSKTIRESGIVTDIERKQQADSSQRGRPGQQKFRKDVLAKCPACIITNVSMPLVLEAAHIKPYKYKGDNDASNGIALRTDIHLLFDANHLLISPDGEITLTNAAQMQYGVFPKRIVIPPYVNKENLRWRMKYYWDNSSAVSGS